MKYTLGEGDPELYDTLGGTFADGYDESARRALYGRVFRGGKRVIEEARSAPIRFVFEGGIRVPVDPRAPPSTPLK